MIQHAFTGAYESQVSAQNQGINTISSGVKDAATLVLGSMGFSGQLGTGAFATGAKHALAGKVGGVGGNIMLATMQQKKDTALKKQAINNMITPEEASTAVKVKLGDNPINRAAIKELDTVFDTLVKAKQRKTGFIAAQDKEDN